MSEREGDSTPDGKILVPMRPVEAAEHYRMKASTIINHMLKDDLDNAPLVLMKLMEICPPWLKVLEQRQRDHKKWEEESRRSGDDG